MSDKWVFLTAFLTLIVVVAGAFAMPQYFAFELLKSLLYLAVALMVFFGEDKFSYMLGMIAPPLWFILNILLGGFFGDLLGLWNMLRGRKAPALDTPLHGLSIILAVVLVIFCYHAWHRQVTEKFFGRTFWICFAISMGYVAILAGWYMSHLV